MKNQSTINVLTKSLCCLLCLFSLTSNVNATDDLKQEISINSKRQTLDLKNRVASYLENVVISQGSLEIRADSAQVFGNTENDDKIYLISGSPAIFKRLLADGKPIEIEAKEIKYDPALFTISIEGKATVRQEGSEVTGSRIVYNTKTEQLNAESLLNETVKTIIKPKAKAKQN